MSSVELAREKDKGRVKVQWSSAAPHWRVYEVGSAGQWGRGYWSYGSESAAFTAARRLCRRRGYARLERNQG